MEYFRCRDCGKGVHVHVRTARPNGERILRQNQIEIWECWHCKTAATKQMVDGKVVVKYEILLGV